MRTETNSISAMVAPWSTHGSLQVSANGHYLHHADGTEFFWLGDTAWHLARLTPDDVERYLANRADKGFTVIHFYATQDPNPRFGGKNYAGAIAFEGEGPPFAQVRLNEAYWQHIDFIVDRAARYGLYVALAPAWGLNLNGGKRQYFTDPDQHNYAFGKMVGQRYRHQPNLIWIAVAEYQTPFIEPTPPEHRARVLRLVDGLRAGDGGDHLMTIHPLSRFTSSDDFHEAPWLAFNMIQTHVYHDYIDSLVSGDWQRTPAKPTLNAEGWYEAEEDLFISRVGVQKTTPFDAGWIQRYQAYWSTFFGSIGYGYGHHRLWTFLAAEQSFPADLAQTPGVLLVSALEAPGSAHLSYLRALLTAKPAYTRVPDQSLLVLNTIGADGTLSPNLRCALRDHNRQWAYVYSSRGEVIGLYMDKLAPGQAAAYWYNPRSGLWHVDGHESEQAAPFVTAIRSGVDAPVQYFFPPGTPADGNDWVCVVEVQDPIICVVLDCGDNWDCGCSDLPCTLR